MTKVITLDRLAEFQSWAKARNGLYYGYGEAFSSNVRQSTDCSGLVTSTGAFFQGMNPYQRYGSTESFRLNYQIVYDLGFVRGAGGPEHFFKVGFMHGGGGVNSHTACTVDGHNWESRGDGVIYDTAKIRGRTLKARAWNDALFHDFWHWDGVLDRSVLWALSDAEQREVLAMFRQLTLAIF